MITKTPDPQVVFQELQKRLKREWREKHNPKKKSKTKESELVKRRIRYRNQKETEKIYGKKMKRSDFLPTPAPFKDPEMELLETLKNGMKGTL